MLGRNARMTDECLENLDIKKTVTITVTITVNLHLSFGAISY